jgi:hypothetical protein
MASVSSNQLLITVTTDNPAFLYINDGAEDPLENFTDDEWWLEWTVEFSAVTNWQASTNLHLGRAIWTTPVSNLMKIETSAGGAPDGIVGRAADDSGNHKDICAEQAWSPSASTEYTFRYHWKKDTDGGADVADNGIASFKIVGGPTCEDTSWDSDTVGTLDHLEFGIIIGAYDGANSYNVTLDNAKLYVSDPGW